MLLLLELLLLELFPFPLEELFPLPESVLPLPLEELLLPLLFDPEGLLFAFWFPELLFPPEADLEFPLLLLLHDKHTRAFPVRMWKKVEF